MDRFSSKIAQLSKYSSDSNWKHELKIGDEVDAIDIDKIWYPSTIIELREHFNPNGRSWIDAKIGFRVYTPTGSKMDNEGNKFDGWNSQYDEWIPLWSPEIAKLNSCSWQSYTEYKIKQKVLIDDRKDPQIGENENQVYVVFRPNLSTSYLLVECLNLFGSEGGYDKIIDLLKNKNTVSFDLLENLLC